MMHAFTAALTCWAIGSASGESKKWPRVLAAYIGAVAIHAALNAAALAMGLGEFLKTQQGPTALEWIPAPLVEWTPAALVIIAAVSLLGVVGISLRLQRGEEHSASV